MPQRAPSKKHQGKDFNGQSLAGVDFSYSDIRGVNFSQANLAGANFSHAKTGLTPIWRFSFIILVLLIAFLAGLIAGYTGGMTGTLLISYPAIGTVAFGIVSSILLFLYGFIIFWKGFSVTLATCLELVVGILIAAIAFFPENEAGKDLLVGSYFSLLITGGAITSIANIAIVVSLAKLVSFSKATFWLLFLATFGILFGGLLGFGGIIYELVGYSIAMLIGLALILLGLYVGRQAISGNPKYHLIRSLSIALSVRKGTRFRGADLTDVDFSEAVLCNADFREAKLVRTNWFQARYLHQACIQNTYLEDLHILDLLIKRDGAGQNYDHLDLQGLNLQFANLQDASLIGANLNSVNLEGANLTGAKLAQAQLYQANLKQACLTGAYIQNWGISSRTQFEGVSCDYIYMQLPTKTDPDPCRKPDNKQETFKPGDFETFIAPIIKTLDLYQQQDVDLRRVAKAYKTIDLFHHEGIDPSAAAVALKQLADQHPEVELEVVALEGRGDEKIRLQARVSDQADRSQLSAEYFAKYEAATSLPYGDLQSLLAAITEKDQRIQSLENMVMTAMQSDKFYVETYYGLGKSGEETQPAKKILILTANPQMIDQRRLDAEVREIQAGLERAKKRDDFQIIAKWAVRIDDLRRALLDYEPHIVHFSGFGAATEGLALENDAGQVQLVSNSALANLFEVFKGTVECVLLNACYSLEQAEAIRQHIPYVIGMSQAIGDQAALEFAVGFYDAIGAGRSIEDAFKLGCISIELKGIPESLTPVIKRKDDSVGRS